MLLLGIGSNLNSKFGDRFKNIDLAISQLKSYKIQLIKRSSFYESPSYPDNKNPKFINVVIQCALSITPERLASIIMSIEKNLDRVRNIENEPRTCDIDIIDYNNETIDFKYKNLHLTIPHKELKSRNFVLIPLQEIYPNWKHPKTREIISALIQMLPEEDRKSILKIKKN